MFLAPAAQAQQSLSDNLAGEWKLETGKFSSSSLGTPDCHIEGDIEIVRTAIPGTYTCSFISEQICRRSETDEPYTYYKVEQSCSAQRIGDGIAIHSEVEEILEFHSVFGGGQYLADNFVLRLTKSGLEMVGSQYDEVREIKARFWRDVDLTS